MAASTSPWDAVTDAAAFPMASLVWEEVRERSEEPSSSTLPMEVENLTSWVLALAVIPAASDRASDSVATSSFAWPSADFARSVLPRASEDACARAAKASRASAMLACASSIWASAPSFDAAAFAFALPSSSSSTVATVELTVATNVSLMVVSSVLAPVSVIFGETGLSFSLT